MKDCVHIVPLIGAREGELSAEERAALDGHLAGCAACRAREAEARALGPLLREGLLAKANERDFAPFVDGVMERIAARTPRGVETPLSARPVAPRGEAAGSQLQPRREAPQGRGEGGTRTRWITAWLDEHRKALAAALVPALAAALLVVYVQTRPGPPEVAALLELTSEGEVTMVLQTSDGPLVLLGENS